MRKFMNLVYLEVNRIAKLFFIALATYFAISCIWVFCSARGYMKSIVQSAQQGNMSVAKYLESCGAVPYQGRDILVGNYGLTTGAVFMMILIAIYAFLIWYRDWFGSNKTIYSLLVLPVNRMKIFGAKVLTIILMGCSVVSTFLIGAAASLYIDKAVLDKVIIKDVTLLDTFSAAIDITAYLKTDIVLLSLCVICIIFLLVLLERSFKIKGIILGAIIAAVYVALNVVVATSMYLYTGEKIQLIAVIQIVFLAISITYSNHLIKKKVAV